MGLAVVLAGQRITPAVLNRIYGNADTVAHTANTASYLDLSSVYQVPASDAQAGTAYRLTVFGNGTWGSTQQALTLTCELAGTAIGTAPAIASTALSASAAFDFEVQVKLICVSTGSSGTWIASITGNVNETANALLPGTAADNTISFSGCTHTAVTQDTTVANNFSVQAKWASTTGSPTLTCRGTLFEKVN